MQRWTIGIIGLAAVAVTACGSASAGTPGTSASASPSGGRFGRNLAAGQLVQINGGTIILSNANGDITVTYTSSTVITQQRTGTVADIVPGTCITATGQRDATGAFTASTVRLSPPLNGSCFSIFGGGGGTRPSFSFSPRPTNSTLSVVSGQVTQGGVNGTSVTVQERTGSSVTITVPTTVRVLQATTINATALSVGQCVTATGPRASSGTVQARSLTVVPPGPSGCFSGGGGGGFPGGGFFSGGGAA